MAFHSLRCTKRPATNLIAAIALSVIFSPDAWSADDYERSPIHYSTATPDNPVAALQLAIADGKTTLEHDERFGYLPAVLRELKVPESSQMLVFSKTSMQRSRISPKTPRAIYFNDDVYVGYCQRGDVLEISTADPQLGAVFYTIGQEKSARPILARQIDSCLLCHGSSQTQGVPGHLVRSVYPDARGLPILSSGSFRIDQTSSLKQRWGGWYVTGTHGNQLHLGNLIAKEKQPPEEIDNSAGLNLRELGDRFDASQYRSPHSDIVALMVLEHQAQGHNLITRANYLTRVALEFETALNRELNEPIDQRRESTTSRIKDAGEPLVKYLLFSEEAKLTAPIVGTSDFAKEFAAHGVRDPQGRSLRDFDLTRRMFQHPCSYLVYSRAFNGLPPAAKEYVWRRVWEVLQGQDTSKAFAHLSPEDRQAIREILCATKPDLPAYWREPLAAK